MKPNRIVLNDAVAALKKFLGDAAQVIAADPPYFQVQPRAWNRAVGYNERRDSFTPATEVILMLRKSGRPKFNNSAAREPYDARTMAGYLRNPRYRDKAARTRHRRRASSPRTVRLIERIVLASSASGDLVLDLFLESGTTAVMVENPSSALAGD